MLPSDSTTLFIGKVFHHFEKLDSTNSYALDLLAKSRPVEGTAISAHFQSKGKGQHENHWHSEAHQNILLSIILYPTFLPPQNSFLFNQSVALAISDFLQPLMNEPVQIKWPNDIIVDQQKIAGILIQNSIQYKSIKTSVVGMGININQRNFPDFRPPATSLALQTQEHHDLKALHMPLCHAIEKRYLQLKNKQYQFIKQAYLDRLCQLNQPALYQKVVNQTIFEGVIRGTNHSGKLLMEVNGKKETFDIKEIKFVWK